MKTKTDIFAVISRIVELEGEKYTNHPLDKGGPTIYGITEKAWTRAGFSLSDHKSINRDMAIYFYTEKYFNEPKFDKIFDVNESIGFEAFEAGVLCGIKNSAMWLQQAINNTMTENYFKRDALKLDGSVGKKTIDELVVRINTRRDGARNVLKWQNFYQCDHFRKIIETNPSQRAFINGWIANRFEF